MTDAFQRATAWIDLGALTRNCARLRRELAPGTELCAVVKANGYGHGMAESAGAALRGGASMLAVATASEAFELRAAQPEARILLMGALTDPELDVALGADAELAVWDQGFLEAVAARAERLGRRPRLHVKHDSGMGRLGLREPAELERLLAAAAAEPRVELAALWTHFATADERDSGFFDEQLELFTELGESAKERHGVALHAANSAATLREPAAHFDLVRCGVAIYGLDPFGSDPSYRGLEPVMGLSSYVARIGRFEPGQSAGYGRRWKASSPTYVGTVPIGYGDGYRRGLGDAFDVLIAGSRYPVVGTVSMDNITLDLGPEPSVTLGEEAVLLGRSDEGRITAEEWARRLGTINYEVTCGISSRVPRLQRR